MTERMPHGRDVAYVAYDLAYAVYLTAALMTARMR